MSRETLFAAGGVGTTIIAAALVGYLLGVQGGLAVGALGVVATAVGVGLYRHISHLHDQQEALEQQVEQQQEKTTTYRRQFEKTQNQLEEVKDEISATAQSDGSSADSTGHTPETAQATAEDDPMSATDVAESAAAMSGSPSTETQDGDSAAGGTATADASPEPATEPSTDNPPGETTVARSGSPSLATVVERSWQTVETQSVVLEIIDSTQLQSDPEQLQSALQDLLRTVVSGGNGQVFTSHAVSVRAQHRNPQSDVTIQNDGGYTPARKAPDRRVVRVGTTENGIYLDCTTEIAGDSQRRLETVKRQLRSHGWSLSVSRRGNGHRIELDRAETPQRRPA
ncbi:hypothetical protein [Halovenus salina]|uniref:hypothetical protein n=1 Tax=Halovenus salina TaxID=1510225 RepID=UPI0022609FED|nr:hypothetical protein [Halovenus salina]